MDFDNFLIGLCHFVELFLVHCTASVHFLAREPISRELDSFPSWLMERPFRPLMGA